VTLKQAPTAQRKQRVTCNQQPQPAAAAAAAAAAVPQAQERKAC
jgi:hypothetical protein